MYTLFTGVLVLKELNLVRESDVKSYNTYGKRNTVVAKQGGEVVISAGWAWDSFTGQKTFSLALED